VELFRHQIGILTDARKLEAESTVVVCVKASPRHPVFAG